MPNPILRPDWQRALVSLSGLAAFVVVVAAVYWARSIFIPVALAIFFTFVLSPPVRWFGRRGLGRVPSVLVTVGATVLVVGVVIWVVTWQMSSLTRSMPDFSGRIKARLVAGKEHLLGADAGPVGRWIDELTAGLTQTPEAAREAAATPPPPRDGTEPSGGPKLVGRLEGFVSPAVEVFGQAGFAALLAVFMLLKKEDLRNRLIRLTGETQITTATKAMDDASRRISRYLFTQLVINSSFGLLITASLFLLDVKYALLWGFLAAVMRYVPYLGTWVGLIPPVVFSLAMSDGWWQPLAVVLVYGTLEIVANNVFEPWLYGTSMGLSEVAQLVAAAFWTFLWGPIGLVLSGPLTVCLLVLGKYVPRFQFFQVLLGDEPALTPDVRLYQRLTARDQDEATGIAREALKKTSPEHVFDAVLIPALSYARRDRDRNDLGPEDFRHILADVREITDDLDEHWLRPAEAQAPPTAGPATALALPARDEADEVALEMFRTLVADARWEVEVAPVASLTSELVARVASTHPAVIVIGSLPPGGLAHTRYLCKRLRREHPRARLLVGRWGLAVETEENRRQLAEAGADYVATSLAEMKQQLASWQPVLAAPGGGDRKSEVDEPVGTAAATSRTA
jgi:predicted PurR-regulated permease PerM